MDNHRGQLVQQSEPITVAGVQGHFAQGFEPGIVEQWQQFAPQMHDIPGRKGRITYGLCFIVANGMDYFSGVEVASDQHIPRQFTTASIPAHKYLVFSHDDYVSKLQNTFDAIWNEGLPKSGYSPSPASNGLPRFFERYGENFCPNQPGGIEIWIPIND